MQILCILCTGTVEQNKYAIITIDERVVHYWIFLSRTTLSHFNFAKRCSVLLLQDTAASHFVRNAEQLCAISFLDSSQVNKLNLKSGALFGKFTLVHFSDRIFAWVTVMCIERPGTKVLHSLKTHTYKYVINQVNNVWIIIILISYSLDELHLQSLMFFFLIIIQIGLTILNTIV